MASSQPSQGCSQEREKEPMKNSAEIKQKHIRILFDIFSLVCRWCFTGGGDDVHA
ncbi:hypothetical protein NQ315_006058 [Exocentrus adspersus]|uniref:Uncharacterized protein n=1 Tax=Exocentrus adspersus TaxID=1586481 RepID=A0AAV8VG96_9CUCU|nr:hypothetical protein NQ315_006058 [Exocentrus adspersus]